MRVVDGDALTKGLRWLEFFYAPLSLMRLKHFCPYTRKILRDNGFQSLIAVNLFYCEKSLIHSNKIIFLGRVRCNVYEWKRGTLHY